MANQNTYTSIRVHKAPHKNWYVQFPTEALNQAARELTPNELKLYLMLSENADNYIVKAGPAMFRERMGASGSDSFKKALQGLFSKGYCVKAGFDTAFGNICDQAWEFYQVPRKDLTHRENDKYIRWIHRILDSLNYEFDYDTIETQRLSYNQQGLSDAEIFYALYYFYIELKRDPAQSNGTIGIVQYVYEDAYDYFKLKHEFPTLDD